MTTLREKIEKLSPRVYYSYRELVDLFCNDKNPNTVYEVLDAITMGYLQEGIENTYRRNI